MKQKYKKGNPDRANKIEVTPLSTIHLNYPGYKIKCLVCQDIIACVDSVCLDGKGSLAWVCNKELCITMGIFMMLGGEVEPNNNSVPNQELPIESIQRIHKIDIK